MRDPSTPRQQEVLLATPSELRDRIRQLGKPAARADDPRLAQVHAILSELGAQPGPLLPVLHAVQDAFGCIPPELVGPIAEGLNLSRAEVHGVITYYHHFRSEPAGRHVLEVCRAESCQAMGSEALWHEACAGLGLPAGGGTTVDGALTLEPVYCLGLCAQSPAAMLDGHPHARLDTGRMSSLVARSVEAA
ncbi:formate dehydrogenase subunit gamma [Ramlibacter sp. G-1-2-2]|uniref:Formate dehydrogenase subunit gamma n=1 Tax=Ramlibacter agri TaxID=2728837 RepID=A0A848HDK5_9BURK|nr:formate dehydrogenase subunit gamma [Ramlibacter agri]NML46623.1 formate dehydrogenase subunit gamma [Ramlibacter agri]